MIKRNNEGYYFISKNGIRYDLYEGITIGGDKQYTSDLFFIFLSDKIAKENCDEWLVDFYAGAYWLNENPYDYEEDIAYIIDRFEQRHNLNKGEFTND